MNFYNLCGAATSESGQFDSLLSQKANGQFFMRLHLFFMRLRIIAS